jgi:bacitracin transport system permease protein
VGQLVNLLYTEVLKLKRSYMFFISLLGAIAAPFITFVSTLVKQHKFSDQTFLFKTFFTDVNFYILMLIGVPIYGVITTYLFNREYAERTLKNLLTIPVSKVNLVFSKLLLLLLWILTLTLVSFLTATIFGFIANLDDFSIAVWLRSLKEFITGGLLLFSLSTPIILVTLLIRNYVASIIVTIMITMVNVMIYGSEYSALYPWSAVEVITTGHFFKQYAAFLSYMSIFATSILCLILALFYFQRKDVQ